MSRTASKSRVFVLAIDCRTANDGFEHEHRHIATEFVGSDKAIAHRLGQNAVQMTCTS